MRGEIMMRAVLTVVGVALVGAGGYAWSDLSGKADNLKRQLEQTSTRLDAAEADNSRLRQTLGKAAGETVPVTHKRALDDLQRQLNELKTELRRLRGEAAAAKKVDPILNGLRGEIDSLKKALTEARRPAPPIPVPAPPPVLVELGFRSGPDTAVVLRYAGTSVAEALTKKSWMKPSRILAEAVRVLPGDPRKGTVTLNYAVVRTPEVTRTLALGGGQPLMLKMVRSGPSAIDWDLSPDERKTVADFLNGS
jgi:hypothetical protein